MKSCVQLFCSIVIFLFIAACTSYKEKKAEESISTDVVNNPATANGQIGKGKLPMFVADVDSFDFGKIIQGQKVSHNFGFKNKGEADLIIADATASCGCTVPEYPKKPIPPGQSGVITVTFNSEGKSGKVLKTITITSNAIPNTNILMIKADIQVP